jgi:hypothetical protein
MQNNDANASMEVILQALTTSNMLLTQMAQDLAIITGVIQGAIVEPVTVEDDEIPATTPGRDQLLAAGIRRLEDVPPTIAQIKSLGFSGAEALSLGLFRDDELRARRQHT